MNQTYLKIIILSILFTCGCSTNESDIQNIDLELSKCFDYLVTNRDFSGTILIGNSQEIITSYVSGLSDLTNNIDHTINSKWWKSISTFKQLPSRSLYDTDNA